MNPKAIMFDVDGTLLDLEALVIALQTACKKLGLRIITRDEIYHEIIGFNIHEGYDHIYPDKPELYDKFIELWHSEYDKQPKILLPTVRETLEKIHDRGIKIGLATTKSKITTEMFLNKTPIPYDALITSTDTKKVKPNPEPLLACAKKLGVAIRDTWFVGDHIFDIQAGQNAGCAKSIGVLTGVASKKDFEKQNADLIINTISELLDELN